MVCHVSSCSIMPAPQSSLCMVRSEQYEVASLGEAHKPKLEYHPKVYLEGPQRDSRKLDEQK